MFKKLYEIDVNKYVEQKNNLNYLSWANAWAELKKMHPEATYKILKFDNGLPYVYDDKTGYMVFTQITIGELTHEMWLPVMDGANKAMKNKDYTYDTKYKKGVVCKAATMFDINKTIMRCLTKNMAMFGLGLYIYAGEDLPEIDDTNLVDELTKLGAQCKKTKDEVFKVYKSLGYEKTKAKLENLIDNIAIDAITETENN